jgi:CRISPR/Cas system CSM-associated protein Csm3 (group 7 of RAMP superfamily)
VRSLRFAVVSLRLLGGTVCVADPLRLGVLDRIERFERSEQDDDFADMPVARDPYGRPIIRGTSVFGALRAHLAGFALEPVKVLRLTSIDSRGRRTDVAERAATLADLLCGSEPEERADDGKSDALRPSALRMVDASLTGGRPAAGRTQTAVSRELGAAVAHKLFQREELHDAVIEVLLSVDLPILETTLAAWSVTAPDQTQSPAAAAVDDLVTALRQWRPFIGGRRGTGHGELAVEHVHVGTADPLAPTALIGAATTTGLIRSVAARRVPPQPREPVLWLCRDAAPSRSLWRLELPLRCSDPLMVSPVEAGPTPGQAQQRRNSATTATSVPGSSWRGLFRSRCEFILRSCGIPACRSSEASTCGDCPTCELFGWTPAAGQPASGAGAAGLVRFMDSPITGTRLTYVHAPIDRFTGGAAEGKLFARTSWAPGARLLLAVEQVTALRPVPMWAHSLLALVVRDLDDGLIGVGNSTTRGYGTVTLEDSESRPAVPANWLNALAGLAAVSTLGG